MSYTIGLDPDHRSTTPEFDLGEIGWQRGKAYQYVRANGAIGVNLGCTIDEDGEATTGRQGNAYNGAQVGVSTAAFADNEYGWLQRFGVSRITAGGGDFAANGVPAFNNTAADVGKIDDGATTVQIAGMNVPNAITDNAVGDCVLNWPSIKV